MKYLCGRLGAERLNNIHSVHVEDMDVQHRRLTDFIDQLRLECGRGVERSRISRTLSNLVQFLHIHFADEEQFMALHGYPKMMDHAQEHQVLFGTMCELQRDFEAGRCELNDAALNGIFETFAAHIREHDVPYGEHFALLRAGEE